MKIIWIKSMFLCLTTLVVTQSSFVQAEETLFILDFDRRGSLTGVYDKNNDLIFAQGWSPYGQRIDPEGKSAITRFNQGLPVRRGFSGARRLLDSELSISGKGRMYDHEIARFLNPRSGVNRFSLDGNNPL